MVAFDTGRAGPQPDSLEALAEHCLAASDLIDGLADPVMRAAIDVLLAEIGRALARNLPPPDRAGARGSG
ncbi:hypothetical protein Q8W71_01075 [Methylobacterium sp. NEAU 140]|uniref:hypothetical protein n=1 Tax=Methylobacterium sp. NEAU 140 TaxID=3064945 RepID=UPI002733DF74|nr:hypothetical protein [Methylobacterium sp. NEAU 140]MDP4021201.1 hypothetical protein [Methylobacterium sp. NEAU 140]